MRFSIVQWRSAPPAGARNQVFLETDNWDDFSFKTLFHLTYVDDRGNRTAVGSVKVATFGMGSGQARTELPQTFDRLTERFFSLGQADDYYENLNALGSTVRDEVLTRLRDVAFDLELFDRALEEQVTGTSLLRSVPVANVRGQFHRLAHGGARLSRYDFSYSLPSADTAATPASLNFAVEPESQPPTNIHVLIGRNGVGKTHLLNLMSQALVSDEPGSAAFGRFSTADETPETAFASLVSVTFSAFDEFEPLPERQNKAHGLRYAHVGLKRQSGPDGQPSPPKTFSQLSSEFVKSVRLCRNGARASRWRRALETLEADPIFKDANVAALADDQRDDARGGSGDEDQFAKEASQVFRRLSSGHKIVLLTITRLVETVEERSLVLLDEPETHLHPPLLSAFVRSLSELLTNRNGVAIVATHSPVVLQEVPRHCVWKVRRSGVVTEVERPEVETFGENVGVLTREVFGLEVTHSGFHRLLADAVDDTPYYEAVFEKFSGQLGGEALALIRALVAVRHEAGDHDV
jgi:predicted ATPase